MPSRDLLLKILGDASSAERALNSTGDHAKKLGGHLGGLGKTAALVAGGAGIGLVVEGLKGVIGAAQDAQVSQKGMEAQLKSLGIGYDKHSDQISNAINKTSQLSAMDDEDLQGAFTRLLPATHDVGKALDEMSLAADIARARHVSLESATSLVTRANAGSAGALRKLGISMEATHENLNHLKETTKHATQAQIDAAKAADKHAQAQDNLAKLQSTFSGAAESYGKSAAGASDRLKVSFENLQETAGQKLLPVLASLFEKINQGVNFIERHWPQISAVVGQVATRVKSIVNDDLIPAFNLIRSVIERVVQQVTPIFKGIYTMISGVIDLIDDLVHGRWSEIWGDVKQIVKGAVGAIKAALEAAVTDLGLIAGRIGTAIKNAVTNALVGIGNAAWNVINNIGEIITGKASEIVGWGDGVANKVKNAVVNTLVGIGSDAWNVVDNIGSFITDKAAAITGWGDNVANKIKSGVTGTLTGIGADAWGVINNIGTFLDTKIEDIKAFGGKVGHSIKSGLTEALGGIGRGLAAVLESAINFLIDKWNAISIHIPGLSILGHKVFSDHDVNFPNIGHVALAQGGIVTKPTLALIGEAGPEAVVPLNRGGGYGITVNMYGDSYGIEDFVDKAHAGLLRKQQTMNLGFKAA